MRNSTRLPDPTPRPAAPAQAPVHASRSKSRAFPKVSEVRIRTGKTEPQGSFFRSFLSKPPSVAPSGLHTERTPTLRHGQEVTRGTRRPVETGARAGWQRNAAVSSRRAAEEIRGLYRCDDVRLRGADPWDALDRRKDCVHQGPIVRDFNEREDVWLAPTSVSLLHAFYRPKGRTTAWLLPGSTDTRTYAETIAQLLLSLLCPKRTQARGCLGPASLTARSEHHHVPVPRVVRRCGRGRQALWEPLAIPDGARIGRLRRGNLANWHFRRAAAWARACRRLGADARLVTNDADLASAVGVRRSVAACRGSFGRSSCFVTSWDCRYGQSTEDAGQGEAADQEGNGEEGEEGEEGEVCRRQEGSAEEGGRDDRSVLGDADGSGRVGG
jgi:hypothetical protein